MTGASRPAPSERRRRQAHALSFKWLGSAVIRRLTVLATLAVIWQAVATVQASPLLLPTFLETARAFIDASLHNELGPALLASLMVLAKGYVLGIVIALLLVSLAMSSAFFREALTVLTAMFNPLPAIALLPIAMLWFGLGETSLIFVLLHSVVWPFALALRTGFDTVPLTQRLVGRNFGLRGTRYVILILIPAALPSILTGLKLAWAFAWRTLIAAELVFGVSASRGGLGWFIFRNRNELLTDKVFAGLGTVILVGLLVEAAVFNVVERLTIRRWGMSR